MPVIVFVRAPLFAVAVLMLDYRDRLCLHIIADRAGAFLGSCFRFSGFFGDAPLAIGMSGRIRLCSTLASMPVIVFVRAPLFAVYVGVRLSVGWENVHDEVVKFVAIRIIGDVTGIAVVRKRLPLWELKPIPAVYPQVQSQKIGTGTGGIEPDAVVDHKCI